ncbi:MAG: thioredoxin family protein, partial [Bacteroidia bacterium]|nr:thioredoxin family protein [Bacteroidia bacterium]MDW8058086.1 thioredoxin family protein [Bacteroidia bacterium]
MTRLLLAVGSLLLLGVKVGDRAPDFSLKNIDGRTISLSEYKKEKGVILIFTCNHCPYAKLYEDRIIALHKEFADKGFPVVAINPNAPEIVPEDSYENMQKRAREKGYPFPYLFDETQEVAKAYGATKTPHVFLLRREGEAFIVSYIGAIDDSPNDPKKVQRRYVAEAIQALLAGQPVPIPETKAIGCSVKYRK